MRPRTVLGLVVALILSVAGCSGAETPPPTVPVSSAPTGTPADPSGSTQPTPADPSQPSGPDQLGEPFVSRTSAVDRAKVVLTLYPVLRDGLVSHVNLVLSVPDPDAERVQISSLLSDADNTASDATGDAADGLQLVDGKNAKLYLVASDGKGRCLCSRNLNNLFLDPGRPVLLSAAFAAPPADLTAIQVRIPNFGTIKNVPVQ